MLNAAEENNDAQLKSAIDTREPFAFYRAGSNKSVSLTDYWPSKYCHTTFLMVKRGNIYQHVHFEATCSVSLAVCT